MFAQFCDGPLGGDFQLIIGCQFPADIFGPGGTAVGSTTPVTTSRPADEDMVETAIRKGDQHQPFRWQILYFDQVAVFFAKDGHRHQQNNADINYLSWQRHDCPPEGMASCTTGEAGSAKMTEGIFRSCFNACLGSALSPIRIT